MDASTRQGRIPLAHGYLKTPVACVVHFVRDLVDCGLRAHGVSLVAVASR
jgi:hypothetical protein